MAKLPLINSNAKGVFTVFKRHQVKLLKVISRHNKLQNRNYRNRDLRMLNMDIVVNYLLANGADVNTASSTGETPLLAACRYGFTQVAKRLIQNNANVNCAGKRKQTPLHLSLKGRCCFDIAKILVENGANVNAMQKGQITPLHLAAIAGDLNILKLLLRHGAKVNEEQKNGSTALHLAVENGGHELLVETLLQSGADVNAMNDSGKVPIDLAIDGIFNYELWPEDCIKNAKNIARHVVKMLKAQLFLFGENLNILCTGFVDKYAEKCMEEIEKMSSVKFKNTNVSFCDILIKNSGAVARLLRNECIVKEIELGSYKEKFPLYGDLIEINFNKGLERNRLLEYCRPIFFFLFYQLPVLPYNCMENILNFLNDGEIRNLASFIDRSCCFL